MALDVLMSPNGKYNSKDNKFVYQFEYDSWSFHFMLAYFEKLAQLTWETIDPYGWAYFWWRNLSYLKAIFEELTLEIKSKNEKNWEQIVWKELFPHERILTQNVSKVELLQQVIEFSIIIENAISNNYYLVFLWD